jgi:hypothetical protein
MATSFQKVSAGSTPTAEQYYRLGREMKIGEAQKSAIRLRIERRAAKHWYR